MLEVAGPQIDPLLAVEVRCQQHADQVDHGRNRQNQHEIDERPFRHVAQLEHGPPDLHVQKEQQREPQQRRPVEPDRRTVAHELRGRRHHMGQTEAEHDGDENGEVVELRHPSYRTMIDVLPLADSAIKRALTHYFRPAPPATLSVSTPRNREISQPRSDGAPETP